MAKWVRGDCRARPALPPSPVTTAEKKGARLPGPCKLGFVERGAAGLGGYRGWSLPTIPVVKTSLPGRWARWRLRSAIELCGGGRRGYWASVGPAASIKGKRFPGPQREGSHAAFARHQKPCGPPSQLESYGAFFRRQRAGTLFMFRQTRRVQNGGFSLGRAAHCRRGGGEFSNLQLPRSNEGPCKSGGEKNDGWKRLLSWDDGCPNYRRGRSRAPTGVERAGAENDEIQRFGEGDHRVLLSGNLRRARARGPEWEERPAVEVARDHAAISTISARRSNWSFRWQATGRSRGRAHRHAVCRWWFRSPSSDES